MNVAILFSDFGPYHTARIQALDDALRAQNKRLFAIRFSEVSAIYGWKPALPTDVKVVTLADQYPTGLANALRMAITFWRVLKQNHIDVVFLPSYSPLPNSLCVLMTKLAGCKAILMNESWHGTEKSSFFSKQVKHALVRLFDAGLVGGTPQRKYAQAYGLKPSRIFLGYDAVDNEYYAQEAERWREESASELPIPNLPARYFLNLGRFVPKKNISVLIQAYARMCKRNPTTTVALVLVGEGEEEVSIRQEAAILNLRVRNGLDEAPNAVRGPEVVIYPFQQVDKTPLFFSRCEAFILPSLYEEWGLVVNEAMACGVAVLVSNKVGCVVDLVEEGENGFHFDPTDVAQLAGLMEQFLIDPTLARRLGKFGSSTIRQWGTNRFTEGAVNAIQSSLYRPLESVPSTAI